MVVEDLDYRNNHDYDPQYYPKDTFSIPCNVDNDIYGKPGNRLNLTFQQFSDWPRCIPRICVDKLRNHYETQGTCNCEFDECSEWVFHQVCKSSY